MGNKSCCIDRKKYNDDEDVRYFSTKTDLSLKRQRREVVYQRNTDSCWVAIYSSSAIITVIVIIAGGPATLAITSGMAIIFVIYYGDDLRKNVHDIDKIDYILEEREKDNIKVIENYKIIKKSF